MGGFLVYLSCIKQTHRAMKTKKLYSELITVDEFIKFYNGASRSELKAVLKSIGNSHDRIRKNEKNAVQALLA